MKAFPYIREIPSDKEGQKAYVHEEGMDLRDYFASDALKAIIAKASILNGHFYLENAEHAYRMADAMMEARERRNEEETSR